MHPFSKLDSVSRLAAGMAHEFNSILTAMMLDLSLAQSSGLTEEARELMQEMEILCTRSVDLIKQLLAFSRQSILHLQPFDLGMFISEKMYLLNHVLGDQIAISFSMPPEAIYVNADKTLVEHVLLSLCLNARDAMKCGGHIHLELKGHEISVSPNSNHSQAQPIKYVCLTISDTGCGMEDWILKRVFDPFFTTKDVGSGRGLNLAAAYGIVQQHNGWMEVESCVGKGSTFRIYLPSKCLFNLNSAVEHG